MSQVFSNSQLCENCVFCHGILFVFFFFVLRYFYILREYQHCGEIVMRFIFSVLKWAAFSYKYHRWQRHRLSSRHQHRPHQPHRHRRSYHCHCSIRNFRQFSVSSLSCRQFPLGSHTMFRFHCDSQYIAAGGGRLGVAVVADSNAIDLVFAHVVTTTGADLTLSALVSKLRPLRLQAYTQHSQASAPNDLLCNSNRCLVHRVSVKVSNIFFFL